MDSSVPMGTQEGLRCGGEGDSQLGAPEVSFSKGILKDQPAAHCCGSYTVLQAQPLTVQGDTTPPHGPHLKDA